MKNWQHNKTVAQRRDIAHGFAAMAPTYSQMRCMDDMPPMADAEPGQITVKATAPRVPLVAGIMSMCARLFGRRGRSK